MRYFYGVYLEDRAVGTILDLVRFLGEPDAIRFSHITLRGPYEGRPMNRKRLDIYNRNANYTWEVGLDKPIGFFSGKQSTIVIAVDLNSLSDLYFKKDYPDGTPHVTLYDGSCRSFATDLLDTVQGYLWKQTVKVGKLKEVERKMKLDQGLLPFFMDFHRYFSALVGNPSLIPEVKFLSPRKRLTLITNILDRCTEDDGAPVRQNDAPWIPPRPARLMPEMAGNLSLVTA